MEAEEKPGEVRRPVVYRVCVLGSVKLHFGGHGNFDHSSRKEGLPASLKRCSGVILPSAVDGR